MHRVETLSAMGRTARRAGILLLGWLIPGSAHWVLGRRVQALVVFVTVHFMFFYGLFMGSPLHRFDPEAPIRSALEKAAQMGNGLAYWLALWWVPQMETWPDSPLRRLAERSNFGQGDIVHAWAEKGYTFAISSGLLNILLVLKVYDRMFRPRPAPSDPETSSDVA